MFMRIALISLAALVYAGSARASFLLGGPTYAASVSVVQMPTGASALDLSGVFNTYFLLINSDGTQPYHSNAQISLTGPGGISFLGDLVDAGIVPAGSGFAAATHSTSFDFWIGLTASQGALFQGSGTTNVDVSLINYSTTGPGSSTAFYGWDVRNGEVTAVPLPGALPLLMSGLGAFAFMRRRKNS